MKLSLKRGAFTVLAALMALSFSVPAYAATPEKISSVKLKVDCGEEPEAGDEVGSVNVELSSGNTKCYISEDAEYYDTNDDEWERGEIPVIRLELEVTDSDLYKFTSSTKVSVSGFHSELKSKSVKDSGKTLRVDIKLRKVGGPLEDVDDIEWSGKKATWDNVDGADKYEVKLYRNGSSVTTITTTGESFNFYPYMTKSGDYTFKVRAISNSDGEKSEWSDESDEYYISSSDVYTGAPPTTNNYTGSNSSSGSGSSGGPSNNSSGGWVQDNIGWTFWQNGQALKNTWLYVDNNWFYLGNNYYMLTGWIYVDNNWFYLNPISDGTKGAMKTGLQSINGAVYYLNPVSDGTKGAMKTGYQVINGQTYYFDTSNGAMWVNRTAPNGKWISSNGIIR